MLTEETIVAMADNIGMIMKDLIETCKQLETKVKELECENKGLRDEVETKLVIEDVLTDDPDFLINLDCDLPTLPKGEKCKVCNEESNFLSCDGLCQICIYNESQQ